MTRAVGAGAGQRVDGGAVLLVDDEAVVRRSLRRILERAGHRVTEAVSLAAARLALDVGDIDVMILDLGLSDGSGLSLLSHISAAQTTAVVVFTASTDRLDMQMALSAGVMGYLPKSVDPLAIEAQVEAALAQLRAWREMRAAHALAEGSLTDALLRWGALPKDIALRLCGAWDMRHVETGAHVRRIGVYTEEVARTLGWPSQEAIALGETAILHDIGKLAIPDAILGKPGRLTEAELVIMRQHTVEGARMLSGLQHPFLERAAVIALEHHERWDGSGYPRRLRGEESCEDARIVSIVDVYDALGTPRCYKPAWEERQVVAYFRECSGKQFEARCVEALLDTLPRLRELARQFPEIAEASATFPAARQVAQAV